MVRIPHISAVVVAAGGSTRMTGQNKLLLPWRDKCVVESVVDRVCAVGLCEVIVVTGYQRREIEQQLGSYPVRFAYNRSSSSGMASSIRTGVRAAGGKGYFMVLGDMPMVTLETMAKVADALESASAIVLPVMGGRRGNPVAIGSAYRKELLNLEGDRGARSVMRQHPDNVVEVEVEDPGIFIDVDTRETYLQALRSC
jgi:molybdenum cofactor cytidylyltransferase